jgi:hypothetical protein
MLIQLLLIRTRTNLHHSLHLHLLLIRQKSLVLHLLNLEMVSTVIRIVILMRHLNLSLVKIVSLIRIVKQGMSNIVLVYLIRSYLRRIVVRLMMLGSIKCPLVRFYSLILEF